MSVVDQLLGAAGLTPVEAEDHGLRVRIMRIGPNEAKALLVANKDNRPIRPGRVDFYKRVMCQGGWMLTHQGIAFCEDGRGLDLQHRLTAIAESNVTVTMMVTEGLKSEAFEAIDQHERRSISDALRMDRKLTEVAKMLILCSGGHGAANPTAMEVGEVAGVIGGAHDSLMKMCNTAKSVVSSAPTRAAAITLMIESPSRAADVAGAYRNLVLDRIEQFSPALTAFSKQIRAGLCKTASTTHRLDLFARALIALDPLRASLTRISIDADAMAAAKSRAAAIVPDDPAQA